MTARTVALCYSRKSLVKAGGTEPASPALQRELNGKAAASLGLTPEFYEDTSGHSSGHSQDRPGWQRLLARLKDADVAAVIVTTWDRAARNTKHLLQIADDCEAAGVRFISVSDNIDTRTAAGRFQLTIIAGVGEYESNAASERRVATIDYLRRTKGRHYGLAPFGTERLEQNGDRVLHPTRKTQPAGTDLDCLRLVFDRYGGGHDTIYTLARRLNTDGWRYRDRHGQLRPWSADDVRRTLHNLWLYAGNVVVGRSVAGKYELIPGSHGAILPPELIAPVAARLAQHPAGWNRRKPFIYPLSGLLHCVCGQRLRGSPHNGGRKYRHVQRCEAGQLYETDAAWLEGLARAHLSALPWPDTWRAPSDAALLALLQASTAGDDVAAERAKVQAALDRLADLYADGEITREQYATKKALYLAKLPPESQPSLPAASVAETVATYNLQRSTADLPPADFQALLAYLYRRIIVRDQQLARYEPHDWCAAWAG